MTIFLREMKRNRKYLIIWTAIMVLLYIYMIGLFPVLADQAKSMEEFMNQLPKGLLSAFNFDNMNFTNVINYYGTEPYVLLLMFGSIFAMLLAAGILSKEEGEKTIEFLLAKPVTRGQIVSAKLLCTFVYILIFNSAVFIASFLMIEAVKRESYRLTTLLLLALGALLAQLVFAAIGIFISVFVVKAKSILPISIGVVLGAYFFNVLAGMSEKSEKLKYLTPFKYVDSKDILKSNGIGAVHLMVLSAIIIVSVVLTYVFYNRKNITV